MAVEITVDYEGQLRCRAVHGPSKNELVTDAPADNMGKGEAFSPTDLVATALATCIVTTIGIVAARKGFEVTKMRAHIEKHMSTDAPRRIVKLPVKIWIGLPADHPERALIEKTAHGCPVHQSLRADIEIPIEFIWEG
jgi:putative redox protein